MIAAFMLYSILCSALAATAARLIESALAAVGRPRRHAWSVGIAIALCLPLSMALLPRPPPAAPPVSDGMQFFVAARQAVSPRVVSVSSGPLLASVPIDEVAGAAWAIASTVLLGFYGLTLLRLARRSRHWPRARVGTESVMVAEDVGPAVLGWLRPQIVFPRWLLSAPADAQEMALLHEREHVIARDPQVLTLAMLLFALFPWNAPLAWMLRRLRFAMEVDCDARVVRAGFDSARYGETLLFVSQRQSAAPITSIALIEHSSQLERRINIMFAAPRKFPVLAAGLSLALAASCLFAATALTPPAGAAQAQAPLKPTPTGGTGMKLGRIFERLLLERFPGLLESDTAGAVVVVLVNDDWSIAKAEKVTAPESGQEVEVDEGLFALLGLARESVPYVGAMRMQSPNDPGKFVGMIYTERAQPGKHFVSRLFPDTRAVDREIFRRYFPDAASKGVPAGQSVWVLLDRAGRVLRSGQEVTDPKGFNGALETRYPGIKTEGITVTPITDDAGEPLKDAAGKDLQLNSVWLAPQSPLPRG